MEAHYYHVNINWNTERKGMMCSPELNIENGNDNACIEVATPPEFPKGVPGIWSPEHLLTAAVSSCLMTSFLAVAENSKLDFVNFSCKSKGKLDKTEGGLMMTEILLEPIITIKEEKTRARAERILQKAESICLITKSIKSKVVMNPTIIVAQL